MESWDGTELYYTRNDTRWPVLYSRPIGGGTERQIATGVMPLSVFPTHEGIYYASFDPKTLPATEIRFLSFASAKITTLYRFESIGSGGPLSVTPDGKTIVYSGVNPSKNDDLMLVQNFR